MRRALVAVVTLAALVLPVARPALAAEVVIATIANSQYVPTLVIVPNGSSLRLVQLDPSASHDVVSLIAPRGRPLFGSKRTLAFGETDLVPGVEKLRPATYPFTCSIHRRMMGNLMVRE